jgi:hypothetical protein
MIGNPDNLKYIVESGVKHHIPNLRSLCFINTKLKEILVL